MNRTPFVAYLLCSAGAMGQGLPVADAGLRQAVERTVYALKDSGHGTWNGENRAQRLSLEFDLHAARLSHPQGRIEFRLNGYGYGERLDKPAPPTLTATGNRLEYQRGDLTEWYENGSQGLEQGFTLTHRPPAGRRGEPLAISLGVTGDLSLEQQDGSVLLAAGTDVVLRYAGLTAKDSRGRTMPSRMEVIGREIRLLVEDREAQYPLVVDPTWSEVAELEAPDGINYDVFGYSISVSGNTAFVGAYAHTVGSNGGQGVVYVFVLSGTSWNQQQELTSSDGATGDQFGYSVSVSGDTAVIGALLHGGTGAAYVFVRSGTTWSQQAELNGSDLNTNDNFGSSVSVSGGTAAVGARRHKVGNNNYQGAAYVFVQSGSDWSQQQELSEGSGGTASDYFGSSVSVSGATAVIGAYGYSSSAGTAYVYVQNGSTWTLQQQLVPGDGAASDSFGDSVSVSGGTALIGAPGHKVGTIKSQGAAYVFVQSAGTWSLQQELAASDGVKNDDFGASVSLNGGTAVVGAPAHKVGANTGQGAAYVFAQRGSWTQQSELTASDGAMNDRFGSAVSVSGGVAAVGAYDHAFSGNTNQGAAYVFSPPASLSISTAHSSPVFQSGPGTITLSVANAGGPTVAAASVSDTVNSALTLNSADPGCSVSGQTATCTIPAGSVATSTAFGVYVTAASNAGASISNTATLTDATDPITSATGTDTVAVTAQAPQVDSSLSQTMLSGTTDNGSCADGNLTLTATDALQNTSGSTLTNPYAAILTLTGGNTLISQSASSATVAAGAYVTFTFHIQLATCGTFRLTFDVRSN